MLVTGNVQITNNAVLSTMDVSIQKLDTVSGNLDIFSNDLLVVLGSAFPFPGGGLLVTGCVSIHNNPALLSLGSAFHGLVTTRRALCRLRQCRVGHAGVDAAFSNLVTVTGHLRIYDNDDELAMRGAAFQA